MNFNDSSSAGTSTIINSGAVTFKDTSTAAQSELVAEYGSGGPGTFFFQGNASGGTAQLVGEGGAFDISGETASGVSVGSIDGSGNIYLGGKNLTFGSLGTNTSVSAVISDGGASGGTGGGITKVGSGTTTLTAANTYTGNTTVDSGGLAVSGSSAQLGTFSSVISVGANPADNGALTVSGGGHVSSLVGYIGESTGSVGSVAVTGTGSYWNSNFVQLGLFGTGSLMVSNGGEVSGTGYLGEQAGSTGNATVTGTGSLWNTGGSIVGESGTGTLTVSSGGLVQVGNGTGTLTVAQQSGSAGTLNVGSGAASGTVSAAEVTGGAGTAKVNFGQTDSLSFAPKLTGSLSVTQSGSGTTTLAVANTYTGGTTVAYGALLLGNGTNGSATGSGLLSVAAGATIGGAGTSNSSSFTIKGNVLVGNGTDVTSQTTLTATGASTIAGANLVFNLGSGAAQGQSNELNLGATPVHFSNTTLTLNLVGVSVIPTDTAYTLITMSGPINATADGLTLGSNGQIIGGLSIADAGGFGTSSNGYTSGFYNGSYLFISGDNIDVEVVPEPSTWALVVGGILILVAKGRSGVRTPGRRGLFSR